MASKYLPAGMCSSARLNRGIGIPLYISCVEGSEVYDMKGNECIDQCTSFDSVSIGHGHSKVIEAFENALSMGKITAYENELHVRRTKRFAEAVPSIDLVHFT